ncbi:hypothetical protein BR93DRAFT_260575 [Coniochaeta sp. PMI_546]|nr:hypothetical protein BR93DRAFT_260575 [Coniochaeta sp. PMI_546]
MYWSEAGHRDIHTALATSSARPETCCCCCCPAAIVQVCLDDLYQVSNKYSHSFVPDGSVVRQVVRAALLNRLDLLLSQLTINHSTQSAYFLSTTHRTSVPRLCRLGLPFASAPVRNLRLSPRKARSPSHKTLTFLPLADHLALNRYRIR